jgi:hypothetical protein
MVPCGQDSQPWLAFKQPPDTRAEHAGQYPAPVPEADDWWLAELERERRRQEQARECGHLRRQHIINEGAGLDQCAGMLPGLRLCPCSLFRLVRGPQLGNV